MWAIVVAIGVGIKTELDALHRVGWKKHLEMDGRGPIIYISTGSCAVPRAQVLGSLRSRPHELFC